ncbi:hypothetical protein HMI54_015703 [Coelomomyces lativittatus]|nr:hypothetical protein HMI54_015703 [Coelomomyces lativittatus]
MAIAGGVSLILTPELSQVFSRAGMLSQNGVLKAFDENANGYVRGEGCGVVILKRLADAQKDGDRILGIIKGSAINQDGRTNGLTAPNGLSQELVIKTALKQAGIAPSQLSYIEAHGTGTPLGDPIELQAIKSVLQSDVTSELTCYVGSTKTNIGHLEAAAGMAGLIKVLGALQNRIIKEYKKAFRYLNSDERSALEQWARAEWSVILNT